ncbi:DUF4145 domain-containing protein [Paracoccus sp. SY]|uniref:DUF4145 domain-containing protein n=1 Tax=Paracoccus sp. SY TaxID=1330255 RepID=UPI0011AECBEE|nr:DUF4145 domain-containing protein [Paracoccus sp. SY]
MLFLDTVEAVDDCFQGHWPFLSEEKAAHWRPVWTTYELEGCAGDPTILTRRSLLCSSLAATDDFTREHMSFDPDKVRGHCPACGPDRWADVMGHASRHEEYDLVWLHTDHRILQCRACETIYHQTDSVFSEDEICHTDPVSGEDYVEYKHKIEHWPSPIKRERPDWLHDLSEIDPSLHDLMQAVYVALDSDLDVLAAIGLRTAFDRATEVLGIDPAKRFGEKLSDLQDEGFVGLTEKNFLSVLTDAGGAAAHRAWRPSTSQLDTMMSIAEGFIQRTLITRAEADRLKIAVPPKPRRRQATTQKPVPK